jgi:hypothetical protein
LNWLAVAMLPLIFVVPSVSEGIAQEPQQADPNAPQKTIRGYKLKLAPSGEPAKDEEGNWIFVPVYVDEPNEVPPVAIPSTQPPAPPAALGVGLQRTTWDIGPEVYLQRTTWDIGPEVYSFKYEEPGLMEDEGIFYGVRLGYTFREWAPSSPKESPSDGGAMFRAEGRLAFGQVDYDGELMDGTPYTIDGIDDFALEGRLLLGADMLRGDTLNTLYTGIGYRYLNDDTSFDPAGYERESNYLYVPLGYQFDSSDKVGWSFGFNAEFDFFIVGYQRSHTSDYDPILLDVDNRQESGYGYRASVRFQHKSKDAIFVIEPFFRYWDINDSEVSSAGFGEYGLEPANETTEVGIQLFWMF